MNSRQQLQNLLPESPARNTIQKRTARRKATTKIRPNILFRAPTAMLEW